MFGIGSGQISGMLLLIIYLLLICSAVMVFFIPFWIFRIRNEIIKSNKMLGALIELNGGKNPNDYLMGNSTMPTKKCLKCGQDNRTQDHKCVHCGTMLP